MKNIYKCGAFCTALFMLVFAGCSNSMNLPLQPETGLKITIKSDIESDIGGARTLYPSQPIFSKYVLELTKGAENQEITINDGNSKNITGLSAGVWDIKVTGYINIQNTDYAAAEGTKKVTVTDGQFEGVVIDISAVQNTSQPGFLSLSLSYPTNPPSSTGDKPVNAVSKAELYIYHIGFNYQNSKYDYKQYHDRAPGEERPADEAEIPDTLIYVDAGYYMMTLLLDVNDNFGNYYRTVPWTEVIHVYSGMETRVEKTFTMADLNTFVTLGGPLNVTVNGSTPTSVSVRLHLNADYTDIFAQAYSTGNNWQVSIPAIPGSKPVVFYLSVEASSGGTGFIEKLPNSVTVGTTDVTYPPITVNFSGTVTLNGTADVKINNASVAEAEVVAYNTNDTEIGRSQVEVNGTWQMLLASQYIGTTVSFRVIAKDPVKGYNLLKDTGISRTLSAQNASIAINVNITTIKLSGTADITIYGSRPNYASIEVYRRGGNNEWLASCAVDRNDNYSWVLSLPFDLAGNYVDIKIEGYDSNGTWYSRMARDRYQVPQSDANLNLNGAL